MCRERRASLPRCAACRRASRRTCVLNRATPAAPELARLFRPYGLAFDTQWNLYVSEWTGNRVRRVTSDFSAIVTVAGSGAAGSEGDGGPALRASLSGPTAIAYSPSSDTLIVC